MRVLLFSHDVVGDRMAGPAIRYWELARELARHHDVTLAVPQPTSGRLDGVRVVVVGSLSYDVLAEADVCVTQIVPPGMARAARRNGVRLVADLYDPLLLEALAADQGRSAASRHARWRRTLAKLDMTLLAADSVICASERQRDLWLGHLAALGRLTPQAYDDDASLRSFVDVVPFGLPLEPAQRTGAGFREAMGIPAEARVLLWGGGLWNWFDPLTLIRAMATLRPHHPDIHLVFMGVNRPNERLAQPAMTARAMNLADELDLRDRTVHFNLGWVPYAERHNHLLDADVGVSTHFDHLETRFAFRTRMLDYLWAGLPILCTDGDSFAELVRTEGIGLVVPPEAPEALADAIAAICTDDERRAAMRAASRRIAQQFRWDVVAAPLRRMVEHPSTDEVDPAALRRSHLRYARSTLREVVVDRRFADVRRAWGSRRRPTERSEPS